MKITDFYFVCVIIILLELVSESQENFRSNRITFPQPQSGSNQFRQDLKMIPLNNRKSRSFVQDSKKIGKAPTFKLQWPDPEVQTVHRYAAMTALLNCTVKAWPKPEVIWYRNNIEVTSENDRPGASKAFTFYKRRQILKIEESVPTDNGNYSCLVSNRHGQVQRFFTVSITGRRVAQKPEIHEDFPGNFTQVVGSEVSLECPIVVNDSFDPPEMLWIEVHKGQTNKGGLKYSNGTDKYDVIQKCSARGRCENGTGGYYYVEDARKLQLYNLSLSDSSEFCCFAKNSYGTDGSCGWVNVITEAEMLRTTTPVSPGLDIAWKIIIPVVVVLCFGIIFLAVFARRQYTNRKKTDECARKVMVWTKRVMITMESNNNGNSDHSNTGFVEPRVTIEKCKVTSSGNFSSSQYSEYEYPHDPKWEYDRSKLSLKDKLGEGAFGFVSKAELKHPDGYVTYVAVKMLKEGHTDNDVKDLVKEIQIMKTIGKHDNIINLLGVCTQPVGHPLYVIVEYAKHGNLRNYLIDRREGVPCANCSNNDDYLEPDNKQSFLMVKSCSQNCIITLGDLLNIGWQVAKGMEFLYLTKCLHRDLAARNILVCENNHVKIADFGMARSVEETDYYRKSTEGKVPLKWMAPEAVHHRLYTSQSDIWSYGILLWEIMTMGESPFKDVHFEQFMEDLRTGAHPAQPPYCPNNVYTVMQACWRFRPEDRPTWDKVVDSMYDLCLDQEPHKYLQIDTIGGSTIV